MFKKHREKYLSSPSFHAAQRLFIELEEIARTQGKRKSAIIKDKTRIMREGFSKADAQVIWEDGPEDWAELFIFHNDTFGVDYVIENGYTISFYDKY
jgi:hypothetical protein